LAAFIKRVGVVSILSSHESLLFWKGRCRSRYRDAKMMHWFPFDPILLIGLIKGMRQGCITKAASNQSLSSSKEVPGSSG